MSKRHYLLLLMATVLLAGLAIPVRAQSPLKVGDHFPITIESNWRSDNEGYSTDSSRVFELHHEGASYIAIHFADFALATGEYVTISDAYGKQKYTLRGRGKMDAGTFWARHIKGDTAVIEYFTKDRKLGKGFEIDEYVAGNAAFGGRMSRAICGADDKLNAVCYQSSHPTEYDRSRAVARLLIQGSGLCTGWLASAFNHFITNEHCITTASDALNTDYEFMAEAPNCTDANCQLCYAGTVFSGATFIQDNAGLDYALVQITTGNPAGTYGFLNIDNRTAVVGEEIYIPQHPGGRAKELGINSSDPADTGGICHVTTFDAPCSGSGFSDVGYQCDTEGGSSGSPVLARSSHEVIALHHCANCPNRGVPIDLICTEICSKLGPCIVNADCDDNNPCTTDICTADICSNDPINCPAGQVCDGGNCVDICANTQTVSVPSSASYVDHSGWFDFVATSTRTSIELCGSSFDTVMDAYNDACSVLIVANDDCNDGSFGANGNPSASCYGGSELTSCLCLSTTPGTTYRLNVFAYPTDPPPSGGSIVLTISNDSCGSFAVISPATLAGEPGFSKDSYVSFDPTTNGSELIATRVTRVGGTDKYVDCSSLTDLGSDGWVATLIDGPLPAPGDTTYYCDLGGVTTGLHVRGCSVVPGNTYDVAMTTNGSSFSVDLSILTTPVPLPREYGDTVGSFVAGVWTAQDGLVTTNDIVAAVKKFSLDTEAAILARLDTDGGVPNAVMSSSDILRSVTGFAGQAFGSGVTGCSTGTCIPPQAGVCE